MNHGKLSKLIEPFRARDPKVAVTLNPEQSAISILRGKLADPVRLDDLRKAPFDHARAFLNRNRGLLGKIDMETELEDARVTTDRQGMTHVIFNQKYGPATVLGGTLSAHYDEEGTLYLIKSDLASSIDLPKAPRLSAEEALKIAQEDAGGDAMRLAPGLRGSEPALVVADAPTLHQERGDKRYYLCWKFRLIAPKSRRCPDCIYLVDAISGKVLLTYPAIQTGTGVGFYSQGTALNSEASGATCRLRDTVTSSSWPVATKPVIHTFDDACSTSLGLASYSEDANCIWDNGGTPPANRCDDQRPEVDVHRYLGYVLSYYYLTHGLNSLDNLGMDVKGHAHNMYMPGQLMPNNAFWDPGTMQIYFGDGDGINFNFFTPLDVAGHEFTHGVNDMIFNIVQVYSGETGALNEAIADLFGCLVALDYPAEVPNPWNHGYLYHIPPGHGRNMADPSRDSAGVVQYDDSSENAKYSSAIAGYYPDHYSIRYMGTKDYYGVHINCPIIAHAVYLMIHGGTHRLSGVSVAGIGQSVVEELLYHVISSGLLAYTSVFADFRKAFILACLTHYPENLDYLATVKASFHAVGIGPDLYIRDTIADQGAEPGTLSCMSPDIILRQQQADAATLALISDVNNGSLGHDIALGPVPSDHYVYFRIFNRGDNSASGTFRLFISPVSTFPVPGSWQEVGHFDFPSVPGGGFWIPSSASDCILLPAAVIGALGAGHFCFIGLIESDADPAPDRMMIHDELEFHDFISKSNNYAWRNCDIIPISPDSSGNLPATIHNFQIHPLKGRNIAARHLEIDTRDVPKDTQVVLVLPQSRLLGLKALQARLPWANKGLAKIADAILALPLADDQLLPIPMAQMAELGDAADVIPKKMRAKGAGEIRPLRLPPQKIIRLSGLERINKELNIQFIVKFPKNIDAKDITLAFREIEDNRTFGQMNYVFKIRGEK